MIFRQLFDEVSYTYTYLIASGIGREAALIDPVKEKADLYVQLIRELDLKLVQTIDTHTHADHITASARLRQLTNCDIVMGEFTKAECITHRVSEGDIIDIGGIKLKTLYTPGHTDDSFSFVMDDCVFTGDTLMIRATGRTDFQNGDPYAQYDSLFNKLLKLPEETKVYTAHDYKGMTVSTIGEEKQYNPRLQVRSAAEYADLMHNINLPMPKMIDLAVPANLKCGIL